MALSNVYKLVVTYENSANSNIAQNVFHFQTVLPGQADLASMSDLAANFIIDWLPQIMELWFSTWTMIGVRVSAPSTPVFYEAAPAGFVGQITGNAPPPFVIGRLRLLVGDFKTKSGSKAFSSPTEGVINAAGAINQGSNYWTQLNNFKAIIEGGPLDGGLNQYKLIIYRPESAEGADDDVANEVIAAVPNPFVGSQNTRKTGRGV